MLGFNHALNGLMKALRTERNFKVQLVIFLFVVAGGLYFHLPAQQWIIIFIASSLVLALELINSAIEKLCDLYTKETHPTIKIIKDISAAAVLVAAFFAALVGAFIFIPYFCG